MEDFVLKKFISAEDISCKVKELAKTIKSDCNGGSILFVGVLKGAWMFMADIVRYLEMPLEISFIAVSSYRDGTSSTGVVRLLWDSDISMEGKNVYIVEDIIDSGLTLQHLKKLFSVRNPKSINICCLLDKPSRRVVDLKPDYTGFTIPDEFIVGYGLDYDNKFRNLKDIHKLKFLSRGK